MIPAHGAHGAHYHGAPNARARGVYGQVCRGVPWAVVRVKVQYRFFSRVET
ncbi:MAG TPA: hypothetical protein VH678_15715 [Xanthobacteraceae bacterium]|jgi:hypothetical protein